MGQCLRVMEEGLRKSRQTNEHPLSLRAVALTTQLPSTVASLCVISTAKNNAFTTRRTQTPHVCDICQFGLDVWPSPCFKVKKAYVIRFRLLYFIVLYLGTMYDVCECNSLRYINISSFILWPLTFTCDLYRPSRSLSFSSLVGHYIVVYWFQVRSL